MTLTASLLLDLVLLVILVLFFVQGIRRGFVLTLCSLRADRRMVSGPALRAAGPGRFRAHDPGADASQCGQRRFGPA